MIFISHRGNITKKIEEKENSPEYILQALNFKFDVEIDVWSINNKFFLGHDNPKYEVDYKFLQNEKLWCHAKNVEALLNMKDINVHYFWHETDKLTLTSNNFIWAYPSPSFPKYSIGVMPEFFDSDITMCSGICSDIIYKYKEKYEINYD